jgi:hypothetical protein
MLERLLADGPQPGHEDELRLFGQFVGSWDLDCTEYAADGTSETLRGEWHFAWVLGGRAVQDVWICPPLEHGVSLRFYDPAIGAWRSTWVGPVRRRVQTFVARAVGDEIHLDGHTDDGVALRWAFSDITPSSFHWRNEVADGADGAWRLQQTMDVRRAGAQP